MKRIYFLWILIPLLACNKSDADWNKNEAKTEKKKTAEIVEQEPTKDVEAIMNNIREEYSKIKADSTKYKHEKFEAECDGLYASLEYQLKDGKIRMMRYDKGDDHGGITEEYYLRNDTLLFVFTDESSWNFDVNSKDPENPSTIDEVIETRYYFNKYEVVNALQKQAKGPSDKIDKLLKDAKNKTLVREKAMDWIGKVERFRTLLKTKKFKEFACKD